MSRIRTNTVSLGLSFFVTAFLALVQYKIITTSMAQDRVGVWSALFAMGALLGTFTEMGLPQVIVRYGARYDAQSRLARIRPLTVFALKAHLAAAVVMVLLLAVIGPVVAKWFGGAGVSRWVVLLAYLALASGTLRALNNAAFRGLRRMGWVAGLEILFSCLLTVGYWVFRDGLDVATLLAVFWGCSLVVALLGMGVIRRLLAALHAPVEAVSGSSVLAEIRDYWQGAAAAGIFLIAIESVDKLLVAGLLSFQTTAVFQVASRLALFPRRLLYVPMQVINPEITHKWESGRRDELRADLELFVKLMLGLGLCLVVPLAVFARTLILLVSTEEYLAGAPVLWVFAAVVPLLTLYQPLVLFLRAVGHVWHAFVADAGWLVIYLALGSALTLPFGLVGFVGGQLVASVLVLAYTLWAFHRLALPRPAVGFFVRRAILALAVWAPAAGLGALLPARPPLWQAAVLILALALLGNAGVVLGGFLNRDEEHRTIAMLAGRGRVGRLAAGLFAWPRRLAGRGPVVLPLLLAALLAGCGQTLPEGCVSDDAVPAKYRNEIVAASDSFFVRTERRDGLAIFRDACSKVLKEQTPPQFLTPMVESIARLGMPRERRLDTIHLVNLGGGAPFQLPLPCFAPDDVPTAGLLLLRHPIQAATVWKGMVGPNEIQYSLLFWFEEGEWRLAAFFGKPSRLYGKDSEGMEAWADAQMAKGHLRNAALLYNLALDLRVPNAWTKPEHVEEIQAKQKSIVVSHLPADRLDEWETEYGIYRVYRVEPSDRDPDGLSLVINYETFEDVSDTTRIGEDNRRLLEYVKREFPEYPEVFTKVYLRATEVGDAQSMGTYTVHPLREEE